MTLSTAIQVGARRVNSARSILLFTYFCNVAFAALIILPLVVSFGTNLGSSLESDRLFPNFDLQWMMEWLTSQRFNPIILELPVLLAAALAYLLLSTFLSGGAIGYFYLGGREGFFTCCARYFPRLFRVSLIGMCFLLAVITIMALLNGAIHRLTIDSMEERLIVVLGWLRLLFGLTLFSLFSMIVDYAKIGCVMHDNGSAIHETVGAWRFVRRNFAGTFGLYAVLTVFGLLFLLAYHGLSELLSQNTIVTVLLVFVLRQLFVLARIWLRLVFWASQLELYQTEINR